MVPAVLFRLFFDLGEPWQESLIFGIGIVGAALLLAWAAEAAQVEISAGLAIALVALLTVLPEYAVDMTFAWKAGTDPALPAFLADATGTVPEPGSLALPAANLTGGNRLLSGLGWPIIILLFWWRRRQYVHLTKEVSPEIIVLGLAGLYSILIFARAEIALWDAAVLFILFGVYLWLISKPGGEQEGEMFGPPGVIVALPKMRRRLFIIALFAGAGAVVGIAAEPFADGLVETGKQFDISEFLLVQWVAPLASESPEILVASIFTLRGNPMFGMAALISAAVNQWTLLVASLPIVFSLGLGEAHSLPLNSQQQAEIFLTLAQILFAVTLVSKLQVGWVGAAFLFVIFVGAIVTQVIFEEVVPNHDVGVFFRYAFGVTFLVLAAAMMAYDRRHLWGIRDRSVEFYEALRERAGVT
ncbi:MAG: hypothetical protein IH961_05000 [Chloroflexi bacterium]|nr:hypothetical protein [Chloroflexota bacterium]